jgi:hypothetical protein
MTVADLILEGIELFNVILAKNKEHFRLNKHFIRKYSLRRSKKSGKPDLDIPGIVFVNKL